MQMVKYTHRIDDLHVPSEQCSIIYYKTESHHLEYSQNKRCACAIHSAKIQKKYGRQSTL